MLKSTPIEENHLLLGAKMLPFGGWNMPIHYREGILAEHHHTRTGVSMFDCSHMGEFTVRGRNAAQDLDGLLPRKVSDQKLLSCRYNFLLNENGGAIDDLITFRVADDEYFIVVNAGNTSIDAEHIKAHLSSSTEFIDQSAEIAKYDPQGPEALALFQKIEFEINALPRYYRFVQTKINGIACLLSRTGYTGEVGFEIYFHRKEAERLWDFFLDQEGVKPAGLGARDTLRLEMGYPLYGHELNPNTNPIEAGFAKLIDFKHPFIGSEALSQNRTPKKYLVGIEFSGRRCARQGAILYTSKDNKIGYISSGSFSPSLQHAIAMGYVTDSLSPGTPIYAKAGVARIAGHIVSLPFYKHGTARQS